MNCYVALLRGINVGGNNMIKMAELKVCLEKAGLSQVRTYIQSGNIVFTSVETDELKLAEIVQRAIQKQFGLSIVTLVLSHDQYTKALATAPKSWGVRADWKHNALFLLPPYDVGEIVSSFGALKPGIEELAAGEGILFQSVSWKDFGKSRSAKLAANPIYKKMTIRNYNTAIKLLRLMDEA